MREYTLALDGAVPFAADHCAIRVSFDALADGRVPMPLPLLEPVLERRRLSRLDLGGTEVVVRDPDVGVDEHGVGAREQRPRRVE